MKEFVANIQKVLRNSLIENQENKISTKVNYCEVLVLFFFGTLSASTESIAMEEVGLMYDPIPAARSDSS